MCVNIIISMGSLVKRIGMTSIEETWPQLSGFAIERRPVTAVQVVEMAGPVDLYVRVGDPYLIVGVDGPEMLASLHTETDGCGLRIWQEPPRRSAPPALTVVRVVNGRIWRDVAAGEVIINGHRVGKERDSGFLRSGRPRPIVCLSLPADLDQLRVVLRGASRIVELEPQK